MAMMSSRVMVHEEAGIVGKTSNNFDKAWSDFSDYWHVYLAIGGLAKGRERELMGADAAAGIN